jgi:hypothetical protein
MSRVSQTVYEHTASNHADQSRGRRTRGVSGAGAMRASTQVKAPRAVAGWGWVHGGDGGGGAPHHNVVRLTFGWLQKVLRVVLE